MAGPRDVQINSFVPENVNTIWGTMNKYQVFWIKEEDSSICLKWLSCTKYDRDCSHYGIVKYTYSRRVLDEEYLLDSRHDSPHEVL